MNGSRQDSQPAVSARTWLIPADENHRLAAVRRYDILDTPPDGAFDRIAAARTTY